MTAPFWREKTLGQMTDEEWESLCDGCGKCCLYKLEDEESGEIVFTRIACRLLDIARCRCTRYAERTEHMNDCLDLRQDPYRLEWLPTTCAYRLLAEGYDLPAWHPLRSGHADSVHEAGMSVRGFAISEAPHLDLEAHVVEDLL